MAETETTLAATPDGVVPELALLMRSRISSRSSVDTTDTVVALAPLPTVIVPEKPWQADKDFLDRVKKLATKHRASVLITSHPKKGAKGSTMLDDVAGGAAWTRFAHTVLWLQSIYPAKEMTINSPFGRKLEEVDRVLHLSKCRYGRTGLRIGYRFNPQSLTLDALGVIVEGA